jgi:hypothetical protein
MHTLIRPITMHAPTQRLNAKLWKRLLHQPDPGSRRDGSAMRSCWRGSTHSKASLIIVRSQGPKSNAKWGSARSPSHYGILTITHLIESFRSGGDAAGGDGLAQAVEKGVESLVEIELGVRDEAAGVVERGLEEDLLLASARA